ncbi:DDE-type integrase/transposase/recombinase [Paraburkholderia sp. J69-1]|uniref:DDE-type integrase/transposase/recombinase n=1 Tax=unclassified Paraburkholderia TaxID=2615204 RepID=UPI0039F0F857
MKIHGKWTHRYRAVDRAFFSDVVKRQGWSRETITLDEYDATPRSARDMKVDGQFSDSTTISFSKYLHNLIGKDHPEIKSRTSVVLGVKWFRNSAATISGIEFMQRIRGGNSVSTISGSMTQQRPLPRMPSYSSSKLSI